VLQHELQAAINAKEPKKENHKNFCSVLEKIKVNKTSQSVVPV